MNLLDLVAIIVIIIGAYRGWKYGGFSTVISLIGTLLVFVLAYYMKNPISTLLYENMPFR
ncbi:MAG: CvpA family protein, partial [Bacilli bacterium]|nr:CvpA family protein [Bacilli bacterium]